MRQWYAIRSKPKKEQWAATLLERAGIEVYLPRSSVAKGRGKPPVWEPYFPGYLFSRLDPNQGDIRLASYTSGVLYVLGYGDNPWPVPEGFIAAIRERLARQGGRATCEFRSGERLVISSGPLQGVDAIFDRQLSGQGRVRILVRILERLCRAEVHLTQLRRVDQAAGAA